MFSRILYRSLLLTTGLVAICGAANATLLVGEPFDYAAGELRTVGTPNWVNSAQPALFQNVDTTAALSAANLPALSATLNPPAKGVYFKHQATNTDDEGRAVTGIPTSDDGSTIYMSFLFRVQSIPTAVTGSELSIALRDDANNKYPLGFYLGQSNTSTTTYTMGIKALTGTSLNAVFATPELNVATTYFVVIGLEFKAGGPNNVAKLWINPVLGQTTEPAVDASNTESTTDSWPNMMYIRQGSANRMEMFVDEMRLGTTWADVTPGSGPSAVRDWSIY
jgi:hypothetical protein